MNGYFTEAGFSRELGWTRDDDNDTTIKGNNNNGKEARTLNDDNSNKTNPVEIGTNRISKNNYKNEKGFTDTYILSQILAGLFGDTRNTRNTGTASKLTTSPTIVMAETVTSALLIISGFKTSTRFSPTTP